MATASYISKMASQPRKDPEFGARLTAALKKKNISDDVLMEELKVTSETVRLWKRGDRVPSDSKNMRKLAKLVGVPPEVLRYGSKAVSPVPGVMVTDEDELRLLEAYRLLGKEHLRALVRGRAVELLEEFGPPGTKNPWSRASQ